jgi:hypothetical protein
LKSDGTLISAVGADFQLVNATFSDPVTNERGVPTGEYTATLSYVGPEYYDELAYYEVTDSFTTSDDSDVDQYVTIAVYGMVNPPDETAENVAGGGGGAVAGPAGPAAPVAQIPDADTPLDDGTNDPTDDGTTIADPTVPLDNATSGISTATIVWIALAALILIVGIILGCIFFKKSKAVNAEG